MDPGVLAAELPSRFALGQRSCEAPDHFSAILVHCTKFVRTAYPFDQHLTVQAATPHDARSMYHIDFIEKS